MAKDKIYEAVANKNEAKSRVALMLLAGAKSNSEKEILRQQISKYLFRSLRARHKLFLFVTDRGEKLLALAFAINLALMFYQIYSIWRKL